jgi:serine-type D-Ala-D-Ala carboxypeptidase (penicillin-binding protein 5/6)
MRQTAPAQARTGNRHRGILALLAALACLAGFTMGELKTSPSGPAASPSGTVTPRARTATPSQQQLDAVSWPAAGVSAADISGIGVTDGPGATQQVPIASVAKLMTAYVILQDHPLPGDGSGPDITVEPSEAAAYPSQARDGDSLVAVAAGEAISERHALEALLLPSADNMAWILARWDAGSQDAFAAKMNATARRLGMTGTSYTDASGLDSSTVSTAADQVRLGMAAMQVPALAAIAAMPTAVIPVAGVVRNTNTLLGQDGIVGLKTGSTQAAGGCLLIAAWSQAGGHNSLIVAATFGQPGAAATILPNALQAGHNLVLALERALAPGAVAPLCPGPGAEGWPYSAPHPGHDHRHDPVPRPPAASGSAGLTVDGRFLDSAAAWARAGQARL